MDILAHIPGFVCLKNPEVSLSFVQQQTFCQPRPKTLLSVDAGMPYFTKPTAFTSKKMPHQKGISYRVLCCEPANNFLNDTYKRTGGAA